MASSNRSTTDSPNARNRAAHQYVRNNDGAPLASPTDLQIGSASPRRKSPPSPAIRASDPSPFVRNGIGDKNEGEASSFSHLSSTNSEDLFLEEQRAILRQIEDANHLQRKKANDYSQLEDSGCDETFASSHTTLDRWSIGPDKEEDESPFSTFAYSEADNDDELVQEQVRILEEIHQRASQEGNQKLASNHITDDDVIQEQIRIMQEFQLQADAAKQQHSPKAPPLPSPSRSNTARFPSARGMLEEETRYPEIPHQEQPILTKVSNGRSESSSKTSSYQDCSLQLENGSKIRVKGTKHVYESIAAGKAILAQCASCDTVSQVDSSCRALYCTFCHQVSPVNRRTSGLSAAMMMISDSDLARSIQSQEKEVAYRHRRKSPSAA